MKALTFYFISFSDKPVDVYIKLEVMDVDKIYDGAMVIKINN